MSKDSNETIQKRSSFTIEPFLGETINQLNEELRIFESKVEEFDQLVSNLDTNNKTSLYTVE